MQALASLMILSLFLAPVGACDLHRIDTAPKRNVIQASKALVKMANGSKLYFRIDDEYTGLLERAIRPIQKLPLPLDINYGSDIAWIDQMQIEIVFIDGLAAPMSTLMFYDSGTGIISGALIRIRSDFFKLFSRDQSEYIFVNFLQHEIGHVLGLDHSQYDSKIMHATGQMIRERIDFDLIAGLYQLYGVSIKNHKQITLIVRNGSELATSVNVRMRNKSNGFWSQSECGNGRIDFYNVKPANYNIWIEPCVIDRKVENFSKSKLIKNVKIDKDQVLYFKI